MRQQQSSYKNNISMEKYLVFSWNIVYDHRIPPYHFKCLGKEKLIITLAGGPIDKTKIRRLRLGYTDLIEFAGVECFDLVCGPILIELKICIIYNLDYNKAFDNIM